MNATLLGVLTVGVSLFVALFVGIGSAALSRYNWFMKSLRYGGLIFLIFPLAAVWYTGCGIAEILNHSSGEIQAGIAILIAFLSAVALVLELAMACGVLMLMNCDRIGNNIFVRKGSLVDRLYRYGYDKPYVWKNGTNQNICFLSWNLLWMILVIMPIAHVVIAAFLVVGNLITILFSGKVLHLDEKGEPKTKPVIGFAPIIPLLIAAAVAAPVVVGMRFVGYDLQQVATTGWGLTSILILALAVSYKAWSHPVIRFRARHGSVSKSSASMPTCSRRERPPSKVDQAVIAGFGAVRDGFYNGIDLMSRIKQAACPIIRPGGD